MKEITGSIEIEAPPDRVWAVLTDFSAYPKWNTWIRSMNGELKVGCIYGCTVHPPEKRPMSFKTKVVRIDVGKELQFRGKVLGGLVRDDHLFVVEAIGPEKTRFTQSIAYGGPLVPLVGSTIEAHQKGLEDMNVALKWLCEGDKS